MLNLSLDEVKAYAADYTAVPVAKECFADMERGIGNDAGRHENTCKFFE